MIIKTKFKDLYIIKRQKYNDDRGFFMEILKNKDIKKEFPFIISSKSKKNVIRGLHIQTKNPQGKFISVLNGKILDVAVDSVKSGRHTFILPEIDRKSLH